jgi:hypothetical protein
MAEKHFLPPRFLLEIHAKRYNRNDREQGKYKTHPSDQLSPITADCTGEKNTSS